MKRNMPETCREIKRLKNPCKPCAWRVNCEFCHFNGLCGGYLLRSNQLNATHHCKRSNRHLSRLR